MAIPLKIIDLQNDFNILVAKLADNKEIMAIVKILGLKFGVKGERQNMRYGSVMIMADQDYDGSHIKGLLINLKGSALPADPKNETYNKCQK